MKAITKENINEFMEYYHDFHDSCINDLKYNYKEDNIEIIMDVFWSGNPKIKSDGTYETNKTKLKMLCKKIYQYKYKENYMNYIDGAYLKYIKMENKDYLCFATDKEEPQVSIVCGYIEYKEIDCEKETPREDEILKVHKEITNIYDYAKKIYERLSDTCELGYYNKHLIKIDGEYILQEYYMPVISMQEKGDICFNFDNVSYEFYLTRVNIQKYLRILIDDYGDKLSIYTSENCDIDLYKKGDNVEEISKRLNDFNEEEIIGITIDANSFSDRHIVDNFLKLIDLFKGEK